MSDLFAIDIGSTYIKGAIANPRNGGVKVVQTTQYKESVPTTITFKNDGTAYFGDTADDYASYNPLSHVFMYKHAITRVGRGKGINYDCGEDWEVLIKQNKNNQFCFDLGNNKSLQELPITLMSISIHNFMKKIEELKRGPKGLIFGLRYSKNEIDLTKKNESNIQYCKTIENQNSFSFE